MASSHQPANLNDHTVSTHKYSLPKKLSSRTPDPINNKADKLEQALIEDGFRTWGFVIYRCTYRSDSDWAEFLRRWRWHVADSLEIYNGLDLLERFQLTGFENEALYSNVSTATIRENFQQWARTAIQDEQGVSPDVLRCSSTHAVRYRFCLFVNEESLQSVLRAQPEDCLDAKAYVNMLNGWWKPDSLENYPAEYVEEFGAEGLLDDGFDPIEGCNFKDVGWMKVGFCDAGLVGFADVGGIGTWDDYYERPPEICFHFSGFYHRRESP
ncbi:hypothetical protein F1880_004515 [Penicillium rolfsii]|nr:hypothetical protein F1880_004515 [Penicillium rolfsii]